MISKSIVKSIIFKNSLDLSKRFLNSPVRHEIKSIKFRINPTVLEQRNYMTFPPFITPQDERDVSLQFHVSNVSFPNQLFPTGLACFDLTSMASTSPICREIHMDAWNSSATEQKTSSSNKIKCSIVPRSSSKNISRFLIKYYSRTEPMMRALGMNFKEIEGWFKRFIRLTMYTSETHVSVEAVDWKAERPKRVGVLTSMLVDPTKYAPLVHEFDEADPDTNVHPVYREINEFYSKLLEGIDFANMGDGKGTKILGHWYSCVHPNYVGKGVGSQMLQLSETLGSMTNGCRFGCAVATSESSYKILTKNGYKVEKEVKYADYTNAKGEKIFQGKEEQLKPNLVARTMIKEFPDLYST